MLECVAGSVVNAFWCRSLRALDSRAELLLDSSGEYKDPVDERMAPDLPPW